jgi:hypothetical protein
VRWEDLLSYTDGTNADYRASTKTKKGSKHVEKPSSVRLNQQPDGKRGEYGEYRGQYHGVEAPNPV